MVPSDVFLSPVGLLAALAALPIVVLYLVRPEPEELSLPTFRFLAEERRRRTTTPLFERLSRSLLLLLQVLVVLLIAVSLASPYVPVDETETVRETVLVVDTSASMAVQDGESSRFDRAVAAAREAVTTRTSVVVTDGDPRVILRDGVPDDARRTLEDLQVTDAPGDLRGAISQASAVAGENARIVVLSDFAGGDDWHDAVQTARARGLRVDLRQFAGGGADNVGIVDRSFSGTEVTVSVKNFGDERVERTASLGGQQAALALEPGDVATATFDVPAGGGRVELSPGDDFATDDVLPVAAPEDGTVEVLLLTNDRNRYLVAALSVIDAVDLTVESPPTAVDGEYDVVIYSNVEPGRLLRGNVEAGRDAIDRGGGVAIQAQEEFPERYGDLLLVEPETVRQAPTVHRVADDPLTRGIDFQPPDEYVAGGLASGRHLVELNDGTPLLAADERGDGRVLYYGYLEDRSSFKYNYRYPVFWKRAVFHLAGRESLTSLNHETGERLSFGTERTVETPDGRATGTSVALSSAGVYAVGDRRVSAGLLSASESAVAADPLDARDDAPAVQTSEEQRRVPRPLTGYVALAALGAVVLELGYLRRRGDL